MSKLKFIALALLVACTSNQAPPQDASQERLPPAFPYTSCDLALSRGDGVIIATITTRCEVGQVSAWLWIWGDGSQQAGASRQVLKCGTMEAREFPFDLTLQENVHGLVLLTDADARCENVL